MSDSSQPHGLQITGLLHPWDFPGKSTGVGCHCLRGMYIIGNMVLLLLFSCSVMSNSLRPTLWPAAYQASLSFTISQSLLKFMSIELMMPSNRHMLCHPLLLLSSFFPTIRVFSNEPVLHIRWLKYWSFRFSISPFNEYSGLTFFRVDWFDLLAVQGTLKSLLQHHSS